MLKVTHHMPRQEQERGGQGAALFAGLCEFITGAASLEGLPPMKAPEIAFAGRSNVGKSSLINALTGRRSLARTSGQPGRTQQLNFFALGEALMLVDLPGYGYARAPKKDAKAWTRLTRAYVAGRSNLRRVMLLLDSRHPARETDEAFMALLDEAGVPYQIVLTKCDKLTPAVLQGKVVDLAELIKKHPAALPELLFTSATKKQGIEQLRDVIAGAVEG